MLWEKGAWHQSLRKVHPVIAAGLVLVAAQLVFRAWAIYGSWFYEDDFDYMLVAQGSELDADYLLSPHGGHILPLTRLLSWLAVHGYDDPASRFAFAATSTLALQVMASAAALWALVTVFGKRWAVLIPLAFYLFSAMTMPAFMWWAAAMNQVGHQAGLFLAIGGWINYERSRSKRWLIVPVIGMALSLFCDVRGLFVVPLLAMISFWWFATGTPVQRVRTVLRRNWIGVLALVTPLGAYVIYYLGHAPSVATSVSPQLAGELADEMLGNALGAGLVGGPWRWVEESAPSAFAAPPDWLTHLAWVVVAFVAAYAALTRRKALRPLAMVAIYLGALYALLLTSRAGAVGAIAGLQYRYLTDASVVVALAIGLMFLELPGSEESSQPRSQPLLTVSLRPVGIALIAFVSISGLFSSYRYAGLWHDSFVGKAYSATLSDELRALEPVDLVDDGLPAGVVSQLVWPSERMSKYVSLLNAEASFPSVTDRLGLVDPRGSIRAAWIQPGVTNQTGPVTDCGWRIDGGSQRIPLEAAAIEWPWWMRIGYLAPEETGVVIRAGSTTVKTKLKPGPNSLYVKTQGGFDNVYVGGLDDDITVCVDRIEVGNAVPGGPLL